MFVCHLGCNTATMVNTQQCIKSFLMFACHTGCNTTTIENQSQSIAWRWNRRKLCSQLCWESKAFRSSLGRSFQRGGRSERGGLSTGSQHLRRRPGCRFYQVVGLLKLCSVSKLELPRANSQLAMAFCSICANYNACRRCYHSSEISTKWRSFQWSLKPRLASTI